VSVDDFNAERILADKEILELAQRIDHRAESPPWAAPDDVYSQTMVIHLANGETRERSLSVLRGMPERPLTAEEHLEKVRDAVNGFLPSSGIAALAEACREVADGGAARVTHWFRQAAV
jgi:2-methylcitrate dehydratase PrpD